MNAIQEHPGKRVRVSLNEVSEVVHRLANKGKGGKNPSRKPMRRVLRTRGRKILAPRKRTVEGEEEDKNEDRLWKQWYKSNEGEDKEDDKED